MKKIITLKALVLFALTFATGMNSWSSRTLSQEMPVGEPEFADCQAVLDIFDISYLQYAVTLAIFPPDVRNRILPVNSDADMNRIVNTCAEKVRLNLCLPSLARFSGSYLKNGRPANPQQRTGQGFGAIAGGLAGLLVGGDRYTAEQWARAGAKYGGNYGRRIDDLQYGHRTNSCYKQMKKLTSFSRLIKGRLTGETRLSVYSIINTNRQERRLSTQQAKALLQTARSLAFSARDIASR